MASQLLKKLIQEHPNGYVKILNVYYPIHSDLFNFEHIRTTLKYYENKTLKVKEYNNLPVIFETTCLEAFLLLEDYCITERHRILNSNEQISYVLLLTQIASTTEIIEYIKCFSFKCDFWLEIMNYEISLSCFSQEQVTNAIIQIIGHYKKNSDISHALFKFGFIYVGKDYNMKNINMHHGNWNINYYCPKNGLKYDIQTIKVDPWKFHEIAIENKEIIVLYNPIKYDFQNESIKECPQQRFDDKVNFVCQRESEIKLNLNGVLELFYLVKIWKPYKCGYKCDTIFYHGHGN